MFLIFSLVWLVLSGLGERLSFSAGADFGWPVAEQSSVSGLCHVYMPGNGSVWFGGIAFELDQQTGFWIDPALSLFKPADPHAVPDTIWQRFGFWLVHDPDRPAKSDGVLWVLWIGIPIRWPAWGALISFLWFTRNR